MNQHDHQRIPESREDWDEHYSGTGPIWSGAANLALVAELADAEPGTVLDVGCGEGADAVWLAEHGWEVTALDISAVAIARGRVVAEEAGVQVTWLEDSLLEADLATYDLVSVFYSSLPHGRAAEDTLLAAVAPGGTLLFVHHADLDREPVLSHGFDPDDYVQPADVLRTAGQAGWAVLVDEVREREVREGAGAGHSLDHVVRVARPM